MPKIELKNITKKFGGSFVAVDDLTITIEDGDFITLLGPSGCGKTTTLRQIAGLETPTSGEILIDGQIVFSSLRQIDVSPAKRGVGFLFQNYALWPHMTVYQNIAFGLENEKWSKERIRKRVDELLALLRIAEFETRYPAELSGGQQQRVAIARTLATNPKVLLMDEPLSNLDAKLRMEMRTELKRLHRETGATFIYVTHDQLEAMTLATKICLLDQGILQQYAPPLTVYSNPANTFVADFVGNPTINLLAATCRSADGDAVLMTTKIGYLKFLVDRKISIQAGTPLTIGLRPELIVANESPSDAEPLRGIVLSSLPSGMETTLRLEVGETVLSSVLFGSLDFPVGQTLFVGLPSNKYVLFGSDSEFLCTGSIEMVTTL
jgi:multiple sugar transport system ATP-binding protein